MTQDIRSIWDIAIAALALGIAILSLLNSWKNSKQIDENRMSIQSIKSMHAREKECKSN